MLPPSSCPCAAGGSSGRFFLASLGHTPPRLVRVSCLAPDLQQSRGVFNLGTTTLALLLSHALAYIPGLMSITTPSPLPCLARGTGSAPYCEPRTSFTSACPSMRDGRMATGTSSREPSCAATLLPGIGNCLTHTFTFAVTSGSRFQVLGSESAICSARFALVRCVAFDPAHSDSNFVACFQISFPCQGILPSL